MDSTTPASTARYFEDIYRAYYFHSDRKIISFVILAWCVIFAVFLQRDMTVFVGSSELVFVVALRVVFIIYSLRFVITLRNDQYDLGHFDQLVLVWGICSVTGAVLYYMLRGQFNLVFYLVDLVAVFSYYVGIPNRLTVRVIPPLLYTLYVVVNTITNAALLDRMDFVVIIGVFLLVNFAGFLFSRQYFTLRMKDMVLHQQEANARAELLRLASTDPLTGVYNRRKVLEVAGEAFYRYKRYNRPFALMMIDLDGFKQVNDTYGHQQGDDTLIQFSQLVMATKRLGDTLGRIGGDEFCLVLAESNITAATALAERLISQCMSIEVNRTKAFDVMLSASMGVTEARADDLTLDHILSRADYALYRAKETGRNRWEVA